MLNRLKYWKRIFSTYILKGKNNLSFWHGEPSINENSNFNDLDQYYMSFKYKAQYEGFYDNDGIPQLNYEGDIGVQYNPIAISQWALGHYNLWKQENSQDCYDKFIKGADWLVNNLIKNGKGIYVWQHHFNWVYKEKLVNPWYSGLAQGQGLSVLCRAFKITNDERYLNSINKVYESLQTEIKNGGVTYYDDDGNMWIEEYIMKNNPTHILNGFIWALWGVYDYWLLTKDQKIKDIFNQFCSTIENNLNRYDIGYWSLYELSDNIISMRASNFYHKLHVIQLKVLFKMTGVKSFDDVSNKWSSYRQKKLNVFKATLMKIIFKIFYY